MADAKRLVGLRIRELRKEKGFSQEQLAFKADIDRTYIASVENGRRNISIITLERIALALDCDLFSFFSSNIFHPDTSLE